MERYHPRRKKNEIMDEAEKLALLARGKFITLALCRGDEPYIVTLSYGFDRESMRLYFHCANKGDASYGAVTVLRLDIDSIIGKKYQG